MRGFCCRAAPGACGGVAADPAGFLGGCGRGTVLSVGGAGVRGAGVCLRPAAAVAVGSGVFMKKFSFGDEEKIRTGKKLIKGSLFSYAFILAIDLILSAIKSLVG